MVRILVALKYEATQPSAGKLIKSACPRLSAYSEKGFYWLTKLVGRHPMIAVLLPPNIEELHRLDTNRVVRSQFFKSTDNITAPEGQERITTPAAPLRIAAERFTSTELVLSPPAPDRQDCRQQIAADLLTSARRSFSNGRNSGFSQRASSSQTMKRRTRSSEIRNAFPVTQTNIAEFTSHNLCESNLRNLDGRSVRIDISVWFLRICLLQLSRNTRLF